MTYDAYTPHGLYSSALNAERCHVSVWSHDRSMTSHQCQRAGKVEADVYVDGVARPTCAQHVKAVDRRARTEEARQASIARAERERNAACIQAAEIARRLGVPVQVVERRNKDFISWPTGRVEIVAADLLTALDRRDDGRDR